MKTRSQVLDILPTAIRSRLRSIRRLVLASLRKILPTDVISHRGIRISLDKEMGEGPLRALRDGSYEGGELAAIERYIRPTDIVLEMGTGIGFITLFCAKIVGPGNVFTYEANRTLEPRIRKNFALNKMEPHLNFAVLGDKDAEIDFHVQEEYWSSSRLQRSNTVRTVKVKQLAVNSVLNQVSPTMIVMDIEGGECDLVPLMNLDGIERLMIELHPYLTGDQAADAVVQHLLSAGFVERWSCPDHMHILFERSLS
jgi:FkbM family methyltransferase